MIEEWKEIDTEWTIKDIGAPLLASLAEGLYNPDEVLREYVQNAVDAYVDFRRETRRDPQNTVQVFLDDDAGEVRVLDRGLGMDQDDILQAKSIAVSHKLGRLNEFVGFRGIGIWSGLSVCDTLILETTKINVPFVYRLTIDFKNIRERVYDPIPIDELLQGQFRIHTHSADASEHYTEVRLVNVRRDRYGTLLDSGAMTRYASHHLPVPFDPKWQYTVAVQDGLKAVPWTTTYELTINGEPVYRRFPPETEIKAPQVVRLVDGAEREVGVAWYAETKRTTQRKAIKVDYERGEVNNFAVRLKNFAVGPRGLYATPQDVPDADNLDWYVGEIYITDTDIRPDTNRRSFQRSYRSEDVLGVLQRFYTWVATSSRGWSEEVNTLAACARVRDKVGAIERFLAQGGNPSDEASRSAIMGDLSAIEDDRPRLNTARAEANAQDTADESARALAIRRYLRKPYVREAIDRALGDISSIEQQLTSVAPSVVESVAAKVRSTNQARSRASRARTARAQGTRITPTAALGTQAVAGILPGPSSSANTGREERLVRLDLAISAFLAAIAAVVREGSEVYRQIEERLSEELRRRGIDV